MKRPRRTAAPKPPRPAAPAPAPDATLAARQAAYRRRIVKRLTLVALALLAALALTELGLRIFGYGYPTGYFVAAPDGNGVIPNRAFGRRFLDSPLAPPHPAHVTAKPAGTRRVFVFGESAALGTPDPAFNFGRVLEAMLRERHPDTRFEIINVATPDLNSHAHVSAARDCADHAPDLFLIYAGHNELVGPYGPRSSRLSIRADLVAKSFRINQWLNASSDAPGRAKGSPTVPLDDPDWAGAEEHFAANLSDIVAAGRSAGAAVVLCTVGANLRDSPPFRVALKYSLSNLDYAKMTSAIEEGATAEKAGQHGEALERFRVAEKLGGQHPELQFRLARCLLALNRPDEARRAFALARDRDALPLRATAGINEAVRRVAAGRDADRVFLADVEKALADDPRSLHGLPGDELFWDHVHLRFAGNCVAARAMLPAVETALGLSAPAATLPSEERCAELQALTPFDRWRAAERMLRRTGSWPLNVRLDNDRRQEAQARALAEIVLDGPALTRSAAQQQATLAQRPDDWQLRHNFAALLLTTARAVEAVEQLTAVAAALPGDQAAALDLAGALLEANRTEDAAERFRAILADDPRCAAAHVGLGNVFSKLEQRDEAAAAYAAALRLDPDNADALIWQGIARLDTGDAAGARASFNAALALGPDPEAERRLGVILLKENRPADALARFERAYRMRPGDPRLLAACGTALMGLNRAGEAVERYTAAVAADPKYSQAHAALGRIAAARGQTAAAALHERNAVGRDHDRPGNYEALAEALTGLGTALLVAGDAAGARAAFEETLKIRPDPEAANHLGSMLLKEGRPADALAHFQRACVMKPTDPRLQHNCATALVALNRPDEAAERFRTAIRLDPSHARAHAALGQLLLSRNQNADALTHLDRAVELKYDPPAVQAALAWLLSTAPDARLRDAPRAVYLAEESCRRTQRRDAACLDALSTAYAAVGRFPEAIAVAREAAGVAEAAGASQQAALIRRRLPALEAGRPPFVP